MSDFRVEVKIKNAHLYNAIMRSHGSILQFSKTHNINIGPLYDLINLKKSAVNKISPSWTQTATKIAAALGVDEDDIFPGELLNIVLPTNAKAFEIAAEQLNTLIDNSQAERETLNSEINKSVEGLLHNDSLTKREAKVISLRFGLEDNDPHTLNQIGNMFNVCGQRIQQIEEKALRKLRNPESDAAKSVEDLNDVINYRDYNNEYLPK